MRRIRILYFYDFQQIDTGSPKALLAFIDSLDRSAFEPLYWAAGDGPLVGALAERGVEIVAEPAAAIEWRRPLSSLRRVGRTAKALRRVRPDILHVMSFGWNLDLVMAAWALNIPIILHVHTPEGADFRNLHRLAATKVLFCSDFERTHFQHLGRIAAKAEVLHNSVDFDRFSSAGPDRARFGVADDQIVIATVAQIREEKGIDLVLETARLLLPDRNAVFLIAGPDRKEQVTFAAGLRTQTVQDPVLRGRVRFLGSRQDIPELLASSDLFLFPTRTEPFGIAVVEAMAAGLPVIASEVGGIPEIITSPEIGRLVPHLTATAFAAAVAEALDRPDLGREMGLKARQTARERFDIASGTRKLTRIYSEVLREHGRS